MVLLETMMIRLHPVKMKVWYFVTKIVLTYCENSSSDREIVLKFEAEGRQFAKIL